MDDLPIDFKPEKKSNTKRIVLVVGIVALLSFVVYSTYNMKYVDESVGDLHATVTQDISLTGGRIRATLLNDGETMWNVSSVDLIGAKANCRRLAKMVAVNDSATISCSTTGIDEGASYVIVITIVNVDDAEKKYLISGTSEFKR